MWGRSLDFHQWQSSQHSGRGDRNSKNNNRHDFSQREASSIKPAIALLGP